MFVLEAKKELDDSIMKKEDNFRSARQVTFFRSLHNCDFKGFSGDGKIARDPWCAGRQPVSRDVRDINGTSC